jgi:hypothetical protein
MANLHQHFSIMIMTINLEVTMCFGARRACALARGDYVLWREASMSCGARCVWCFGSADAQLYVRNRTDAHKHSHGIYMQLLTWCGFSRKHSHLQGSRGPRRDAKGLREAHSDARHEAYAQAAARNVHAQIRELSVCVSVLWFMYLYISLYARTCV